MMSEAPERIWAFMPDIFDNISVWQDQPSPALDTTEYIRADLARPKVKPLEWMDGWADGTCYDVTPFNPIEYTHRISKLKDGTYHSHFGVFETLEAAKAAAQADYERRILAALETLE